MGDSYSMADALVTAYFFRTECVGLAGLWNRTIPEPQTGITALKDAALLMRLLHLVKRRRNGQNTRRRTGNLFGR